MRSVMAGSRSHLTRGTRISGPRGEMILGGGWLPWISGVGVTEISRGGLRGNRFFCPLLDFFYLTFLNFVFVIRVVLIFRRREQQARALLLVLIFEFSYDLVKTANSLPAIGRGGAVELEVLIENRDSARAFVVLEHTGHEFHSVLVSALEAVLYGLPILLQDFFGVFPELLVGLFVELILGERL